MKINETISIVNDNNPPGSHPRLITRMVVDGKHYLLDRQETLQLAKSVMAILTRNKVRGADTI